MTFDGARVVIVEDDESVRNAVQIALQGEGCAVLTQPHGNAIAEILESFRPDLFILDVRLAIGLDGVGMTSELRRTSDVPILLLTAADSVDDRLAGFRAGADDYVGKPFSMAELLARAEAVLRRSAGGAQRMGDLVVNATTRTVTRGGREVNLTPTEYDLLAALGRRPGRVLSKQELLNQVWGFDDYADNLVEVHVSALRRKLEECGPRVIQTVRGIGYTLRA